MKTLQAFWRWVDNEKPDTATIIQKACGSKALSPLARTALDQAADVVWAMHNVILAVPSTHTIRTTLDSHRDDLRDVSLALLPALEKVNERRGATVRKTVEQLFRKSGEPWSAHTHAVRVPAGARQCVGCGLSSSDEPSVLHPRPDGQARCNDCAKRQQGQLTTKRDPRQCVEIVGCSCGRVYSSSNPCCPNCQRVTAANLR